MTSFQCCSGLCSSSSHCFAFWIVSCGMDSRFGLASPLSVVLFSCSFQMSINFKDIRVSLPTKNVPVDSIPQSMIFFGN